MASSKTNLTLFQSGIMEYPDLLKDFLFQVVFQFQGNLIGQIAKNMGMEEILMLRARSVSLPQKKVETINTQYMGSKRNYPGRVSVDGTVTIKFDEFQDLALQKIFYEWGNMIYNHSFPYLQAANTGWKGGGSIADYLSLYTASIEIKLYDSSLNNKLRYTWMLYDCFPTDNGTIELNAEGNGKVAPAITFNYNTWQMIDHMA